MDPIERLSRLFERFPGIGPRQANRFVQYLLRSSPHLRRDLAEAIADISGAVHQCPVCMRFHTGARPLCGICSSSERDVTSLAVVASDTDLLALERVGSFRGKYFVIGGTVSLASEKAQHLRIPELLQSLPGRVVDGLTEVILAFPANPEGDATAIRVREDIEAELLPITVTALGRGLSTGSELEYADAETLRSAFETRK